MLASRGPAETLRGFTTFTTELIAKRLELLKELVPNLSCAVMLQNTSNPAAPPEWEEVQAAARILGIQAELLDVGSRDDIRPRSPTAVDALVIGADGVTQIPEAVPNWIVMSAVRSELQRLSWLHECRPGRAACNQGCYAYQLLGKGDSRRLHRVPRRLSFE